MNNRGEVTNVSVLYQDQLAATSAKLPGFIFTANQTVATPIENINKNGMMNTTSSK